MSVGKKASIDDIINQDSNGSVLGVSCEVEEESSDDICETLVANVFDMDKLQLQLHKLHIQMAHPPMDRMISRIKTAKAWTNEMQQIVEARVGNFFNIEA